MSDTTKGYDIYTGTPNSSQVNCWKCKIKVLSGAAKFVSFDERDPSDGAYFCHRCYESR